MSSDTHLVVGDVHLSIDRSEDVARDLAALIKSHRGATIVFAGDAFDLAAESHAYGSSDAVFAILKKYESLRVALGEHLDARGSLCFVAGNHDGAIAETAVQSAVCDALQVSPSHRDRIVFSPWFLRFGNNHVLHVEHGHHHDPDNALPHPLCVDEADWRSLGIGLMHDFIAPTGATSLVHTNEMTPRECFEEAVRVFGARAPWVIGRYFRAAGQAWLRSGSIYPMRAGQDKGAAEEPGFAHRVGMDLEVLRELVALGATPTLSNAWKTFLRLYFDRVGALGLSALGGLMALRSHRRGPGVSLLSAGVVMLVASIALQRNRYRGRVDRALENAAEHLVQRTGAGLAVFGHIHRAVERDGYRNTGSFAFPTEPGGRPYVRWRGNDGFGEHRLFGAGRDCT